MYTARNNIRTHFNQGLVTHFAQCFGNFSVIIGANGEPKPLFPDLNVATPAHMRDGMDLDVASYMVQSSTYRRNGAEPYAVPEFREFCISCPGVFKERMNKEIAEQKVTYQPPTHIAYLELAVRWLSAFKTKISASTLSLLCSDAIILVHALFFHYINLIVHAYLP